MLFCVCVLLLLLLSSSALLEVAAELCALDEEDASVAVELSSSAEELCVSFCELLCDSSIVEESLAEAELLSLLAEEALLEDLADDSPEFPDTALEVVVCCVRDWPSLV